MSENQSIKYFISTGCSFTDVPVPEIEHLTHVNIDEYTHCALSWPVHVNNHLGSVPKYRGKGASGNGIISRTTIYEVNEALKEYKEDEILVGIMWSGAYRQELYYTKPDMNFHSVYSPLINGKNPASIGQGYNFYKVMPYWEDELSKFYYKNIYDEIGSYMLTLENILRTQWYLKSKNIKYFMTTYYPAVFPSQEILNHPDIKYLYDMIDFDYFLPVKSEWNWCCDFQDPKTWYLEFKDHPTLSWMLDGSNPHPNTLQHKAFADKVIMPFLESKGWI
jgi:hypothetical protein